MKFIFNKLFKAITPQVLSLALAISTGILCSEISNEKTWSTSSLVKGSLIVAFISFALNICLTICYFKKEMEDKNLQSTISKQTNIIQKQQIKYENLLNACGDIGAELTKSSEDIYEVVKSAKTTGHINLHHWNKKSFYDFICRSLHEYICGFSMQSGDFSVSIITRSYHDDETFYFMISRSLKSKGKPKIYLNEISESIAKNYFYGKLFIKNNPEPIILNKEEIDHNFFFSSTSSANKNKYSQYIGIPVFCSGNNMIALLQIIAHKNSIISKNEKELEQIISTILSLYSNLILLGDKIEKIMLVYDN